MALRPMHGSATIIYVNDVRGLLAVLALLDEVMPICDDEHSWYYGLTAQAINIPYVFEFTGELLRAQGLDD